MRKPIGKHLVKITKTNRASTRMSLRTLRSSYGSSSAFTISKELQSTKLKLINGFNKKF